MSHIARLHVAFVVVTLLSFTRAGAAAEERALTAEEIPTGFIRTWVISEEFPHPLQDGRSMLEHKRAALNTNFLGEQDEAALQPHAGLTHTRADGSTVNWFEHEAETDIVRIDRVLRNSRPSTNYCVGYAYTPIEATKAGRAFLTLGAADSARVWLNGEVIHERITSGQVEPNEVQLPVNLKEGANHLLLKLEQDVGAWGMVVRVATVEEVEALRAHEALKADLLEFQRLEIVPEDEWGNIFVGTEFPKLVWEFPTVAEQVIGECPLTVRWFTADIQEVNEPQGPGRYLAYVEGRSAKGYTIRRGLTFYCRPDNWRPWGQEVTARVSYTPEGPFDEAAWEEREKIISERAGDVFMEHMFDGSSGASLVAWLAEAEPLGEPLAITDTPQIVSQDLHLALKLKVLGDAVSTPGLDLPRQTDEHATVLRTGAPAEAGMKDDAAERIRTVCRTWYEQTGEPFVLLVARNGVIVIHEAFDDAEKPTVDLDTDFYLASLTKVMTGLMFAQFIDQGLLRVDEPIGQYLPDFPTEGEHAITFRQCFTHTAGFTTWMNPHDPWMENVVANGLAAVRPAEMVHYNGTGFKLAAKSMEVLSGKNFFRLMQENFFMPLGMERTTIEGVDTGARSSAMDVARLGQLILNRGAYGNTRFFSEEAFEQILPRNLEDFYPSLDEEWGLGIVHIGAGNPDTGEVLLGPRTLGHGSATNCVLRADPDQGLVIAQVRNAGGRDFIKHFDQLLKAIHESKADDQTPGRSITDGR